jgi:hypothetical protein
MQRYRSHAEPGASKITLHIVYYSTLLVPLTGHTFGYVIIKPNTTDMNSNDLTIILLTDQPAEKVFDAITNVRGWWTEVIEGNTSKLHDEFSVRFGDVHYSRQQITELVPFRKITWQITDSRLSFLKDKEEWTGTKISFEIGQKGEQTQVRFIHYGLSPIVECYNACSTAWNDYIRGSLATLINTGKGEPATLERKGVA